MMRTVANIATLPVRWFIHHGADEALIYSVLAKSSSAVFGLVTIVTASLLLRPEEQGYLATFLSLASAYMLVELGLGNTIIQFTSHEVEISETASAEARDRAHSRLISIGQIGLRWFGWGALLFAGITGVAGVFYFSSEPRAHQIYAPWLFLCGMVSLDILLMPLWFLLEGMNEVVLVYRYRAFRMALLGLGTAMAMASGAGLWSLGVGYALTIPWSLFVIMEKWNFFAPLFACQKGPRINWSREMLPYQARLVIGTICSYVVVWLPSLIALKQFGPAIAGQVGITWSAMSAISILSGAVIAVKIPMLGRYVAAKRFEELDRVVVSAAKMSIAMAFLVAVGVIIFVCGVTYYHLPFAKRILPLHVVWPAMLACACVQFLLPMQAYLRAFKRDPYVWVSISIALFGTIGMILGGELAGPAGFVAGYMGTAVLLSVPLGAIIFLHKRRQWLSAAASYGPTSDLLT